MKQIEIGPGKDRLGRDWLTVGPYEADHVDIIARWGEEPLPIEDNSVDLIYASHVLEHVWWYDTVSALADAHRMLVPNGVLELHVPDFEYIVQCYQQKKCGDQWFKYNEDKDYVTWANGRIFTYGGPGNIHRAIFDEAYLRRCLRKAGFEHVTLGAPVRGAGHGPIDLAMTAVKIA